MIGNVKAHDVIRSVADAFGLPRSWIMSDMKDRDVSTPRIVCYYLIREKRGWSNCQIGAFMKRHPSTVLMGIRALESRMARDADLRAKVEAVL